MSLNSSDLDKLKVQLAWNKRNSQKKMCTANRKMILLGNKQTFWKIKENSWNKMTFLSFAKRAN